MKRKVPSQETGPLLDSSPKRRRQIFGCAGQVVFLQIALTTIGTRNAFAGDSPAIRDAGQPLAAGLGASIAITLIWVGLYAMASSKGSHRLEAMLPVRGRWASLVVLVTLGILGMLALSAIGLAPFLLSPFLTW